MALSVSKCHQLPVFAFRKSFRNVTIIKIMKSIFFEFQGTIAEKNRSYKIKLQIEKSYCSRRWNHLNVSSFRRRFFGLNIETSNRLASENLEQIVPSLNEANPWKSEKFTPPTFGHVRAEGSCRWLTPSLWCWWIEWQARTQQRRGEDGGHLLGDKPGKPTTNMSSDGVTTTAAKKAPADETAIAFSKSDASCLLSDDEHYPSKIWPQEGPTNFLRLEAEKPQTSSKLITPRRRHETAISLLTDDLRRRSGSKRNPSSLYFCS